MRFQAEIAQLVEHATENCGVASPILALGTRPENQATCGRSTVVVRLLAKEKVVGSNPIARSLAHRDWLSTLNTGGGRFVSMYGDVAKW